MNIDAQKPENNAVICAINLHMTVGLWATKRALIGVLALRIPYMSDVPNEA